MSFLFRFRLVKVGELIGGVQTPITPETSPAFYTSPLDVVVETVEAGMAMVAPGTRPAPEDWWKYQLQWRIQSCVVPTVRGVIPDTTFLVFDVDFWDTLANKNAGDPPHLRNTFIYQFTSKRLAAAVPLILVAITDYLVSATFSNQPTDGRDPRIVTTTDPAHDPLGLYNKVASVSGVTRTVPAAWRAAEG